MKKIIFTSVLIAIAVAIWFNIDFIRNIMRESRTMALLNVKWGMSPARVSKALGHKISASNAMPYFDISRMEYDIASLDRLQSLGLRSSEFRLMKYKTSIYFIFFDERLFQYQVELRSTDMNDLHSTIVIHLTEKYGIPSSTDTNANRDIFLRDAAWISRDMKIDYWIVKTEGVPPFFSTSYVARIRATYLPIEREIKHVSLKEKARIF